MGKNNFMKIMAWAVVLGFTLGIASIQYDIHIYSIIPKIIVLIIVVIVLTFAVSLYKVLKENKYCQMLLNNGKYDELIKYMMDKHSKLNGKIGYRQQCITNIANCYGRMGNFQESLNYLKKANEYEMDKNTKAEYYGMYSENLYFLNEDLEEAEELIDKSRKLLDTPYSILLKALISLELDKKEDASQLVELYYKTATRKKYIFGISTILYFDEYISNISEKFMLGLYYKKIGEEEKARKYFSRSASCSYKNYFSDKSKELYSS